MKKEALPKVRQKNKVTSSPEARLNHVEAWGRSGLSAAAYAQEHGLNVKSLYAWRSKLTVKQPRKRAKRTSAKCRSTILPISVEGAPQSSSNLALSFQLSGHSVRLDGFTSQIELVSMLKALSEEVLHV